jgi:hypothetical protein
MAETLTYKIVNSQLAVVERAGSVEGEPAVIRTQRRVIEATPLSPMGKTLSVVLPPSEDEEWPEGATIEVTLAVVSTDTPPLDPTPDDVSTIEGSN